MARSVRTRRLVRVPRTFPDGVYIESFGVELLFGSITYKDIKFGRERESESHLGVIFGDNGAGKTTLLHLLYATLSTQDNAGLRTYLAKTPFANFFVEFSNGVIIVVKKESGLVGDYTYSVRNGHDVEEFHLKCNSSGSITDQPDVNRLHRFLSEFDLDVLFVDHERYVRSTYAFLSDASYPENPNYYYLALEGKGGQPRDPRSREKSLQFPLLGMVEAVNDLFRAQAFRQGSAGDVNASSVYLEIVRAITRRKKPGPSQEKVEFDFIEVIRSLEKETESYISHGLLSTYPFEEILRLYTSASAPRRGRIEEALVPFIASIRQRIAALTEVHSLMMAFENEMNVYFSNKRVTVHALDGLVIRSNDRPLSLDKLSSGEKQLLFLLCAAVVSRGSRSLILIDEPELSLNYKWQRRVALSLARLSSSRSTQFIMATHSIEIISRFSGAAFELNNELTQADA